ncbi:Bacteriocin immunity protein [Leuconostoc gasicomitatum]|nr:hypothetical protein [Leuconostoc gasicomitatum]MBZ5945784.1 hypothetical protein [Leuconostoc gasicomitatum]MBZ5949792.1 hypothetical protein [Leuconostoc gasicomitatum]MBZ5951111.1 hypothetical protein [Leuconostoc gasicomitatum]MBZ5968551.1 hypothetical protein [Leuconostoc gasicomitatum]
MYKLFKKVGERMTSRQAFFVKKFVQVFSIIGAIQLLMNIIAQAALIVDFDKVVIFSIAVSIVLMKRKYVSNTII